MIEIALLALILVAQIAVVWAVFELKWTFEAWTAVWGRNPLPGSDYHAKEIMNYVQEIAGMIAAERYERRNPRPSTWDKP